MKLVILATNSQLTELLASGAENSLTVERLETAEELLNHPGADAFFDLSFENTAKRKELLSKLLPKPVFINSVLHNLTEINTSFIRINGWPTFLKRNLVEASCANELLKSKAEEITGALNKSIDWVPDITGFVSVRIISMIVNEAYFTLQEKVSTKEEIDIAMKLGTNYPYGPFEWSEKIGLKNIYQLLVALSKTNGRYQPASLLQKEATQ